MRIGSLYGRDNGMGPLSMRKRLSSEVDNTISDYADAGVEIVLILAPGAGVEINFLEMTLLSKVRKKLNAI